MNHRNSGAGITCKEMMQRHEVMQRKKIWPWRVRQSTFWRYCRYRIRRSQFNLERGEQHASLIEQRMVPLITCLVSVLPAHLVRLLFCARLHVIACIGWPRMLSQQVSATSPFWLQHRDDFLRNPRFTKCAAPGTEMRDDESSIHSVLQDFS